MANPEYRPRGICFATNTLEEMLKFFAK